MLIRELMYKGHELVIIKQINDSYIVDIRIDDYDGHMMQGYGGLSSDSEAESVGKAFVDGLVHYEEDDAA